MEAEKPSAQPPAKFTAASAKTARIGFVEPRTGYGERRYLLAQLF
jgi:hypothetical protein